MNVVDNLAEWQEHYLENFVGPHEGSGGFDWKAYPRPECAESIRGDGVVLSKSRLLFVSSAGAYIDHSQQPFDAANDYGDYTIRRIPQLTRYDEIAYAHDHYDHQCVMEDPQVLLPLTHLEEMVSQGMIGGLTTSWISFMGYQPDVSRVVNEMIPLILEVAREENADAALLVPS